MNSLPQRTFKVFNESYAGGHHGKFKAIAHYEHGGTSKTQPSKKERQLWFEPATNKFSKNLDVKAFAYNFKTNSVYLCTTFEPSDIINANTYHEKERSMKKNGEPSTRYQWHCMVVFD